MQRPGRPAIAVAQWCAGSSISLATRLTATSPSIVSVRVRANCGASVERTHSIASASEASADSRSRKMLIVQIRPSSQSRTS